MPFCWSFLPILVGACASSDSVSAQDELEVSAVRPGKIEIKFIRAWSLCCKAWMTNIKKGIRPDDAGTDDNNPL